MVAKERQISSHTGLPSGLPGDVPQRRLHRADGGDGHAAPAEEAGPVIHLLPQPLDLGGILATQEIRQPALAADDGVDDQRRRFGLPDTAQPLIGVHAHDGLLIFPRVIQGNRFDVGDFHVCCILRYLRRVSQPSSNSRRKKSCP